MKKYKWKILFFLYTALMLWLLFHRAGYDPSLPYLDQLKYNLVPLHTIRLFWELLDHPLHWKDAVINLGGNVIMFIPLGFLLPRAFKKLGKFYIALPVAALAVILVELAQLFTLLGSCDLDDLILNVIGAAIGYILHKLVKK